MTTPDPRSLRELRDKYYALANDNSLLQWERFVYRGIENELTACLSTPNEAPGGEQAGLRERIARLLFKWYEAEYQCSWDDTKGDWLEQADAILALLPVAQAEGGPVAFQETAEVREKLARLFFRMSLDMWDDDGKWEDAGEDSHDAAYDAADRILYTLRASPLPVAGEFKNVLFD
jgi:hypothetical protein